MFRLQRVLEVAVASEADRRTRTQRGRKLRRVLGELDEDVLGTNTGISVRRDVRPAVSERAHIEASEVLQRAMLVRDRRSAGLYDEAWRQTHRSTREPIRREPRAGGVVSAARERYNVLDS